MHKEFKQLKEEANQLRKNKQFAEAEKVYSSLISDFAEDISEWEYWGLFYCYFKQKFFSRIINGYEKLADRHKNFQMTKNLFAWSLYYSKIDKSQDNEALINAAKTVIEMTKQNDEFSPYTKTIFKILDSILDRNNKIDFNYWIDKIDLKTLSKRVYSFKNKKGRKIEVASEYEKFLMLKSKILLKNEKWTNTISVCDFALHNIDNFHYSNNIWFRYRKAIALQMLNQQKEALSIFLEIRKQKNDWFIIYAIAKIQFNLNQIEQSLRNCCEAINVFGEYHKKIKVFQLLADILKLKNMNKFYQETIKLLYFIKKDKDWKIDQKLQDDFSQLPNQEKVTFNHFKKMISEICSKNKKRHTGKISNIFPHGKAGFIREDSGKSYYFSSYDFIDKKIEFYFGMKVTFVLQDSFDKKKNKKTKKASKIKTISD